MTQDSRSESGLSRRAAILAGIAGTAGTASLVEASTPSRPHLGSRTPAVDPNRDEVAEGAPRLAQHIRSSAKFIKVSAMAYGCGGSAMARSGSATLAAPSCSAE